MLKGVYYDGERFGAVQNTATAEYWRFTTQLRGGLVVVFDRDQGKIPAAVRAEARRAVGL